MKQNEFNHYDRVLVRSYDVQKWKCDLFSHREPNREFYTYECVGGKYHYCIPFEGNEHLVGTVNAYTEPKNESKFIPKDGDFVVSGWDAGEEVCKWIAIVEGCDFQDNFYNTYEGYYIEGNETGLFFTNHECSSQTYTRKATEEEREILLSKLHEKGKDWDAENKEIVYLKWIPNLHEKYFYPKYATWEDGFIVDDVFWESIDDKFDKSHYERGWLFRTYEECQAMCDKLNDALKNVI